MISNLYDTYEKKDMKEKALSFLQKCISRFHTSLVEAHGAAKSGSFDMVDAKYRFRRTLSLCGAYNQAILLLKEVAAAWQKQEKYDDDFVDLLQRLRYSYPAQNPPQLEAEHKTCTELVKLRSQRNRPESTTTLNEIGCLVVFLRRLKRFKEAVELQNQLIETRKATIGTANKATLGNMSYLAEIYKKTADWPKAIEARRELYLARKDINPNSPKTIT